MTSEMQFTTNINITENHTVFRSHASMLCVAGACMALSKTASGVA